MNAFCKYASVVLDAALDKPLDYGIPQNLTEMAKKGMRVEVPVKGQLRTGYIIEIKDQAAYPKVRPISQLLSENEMIVEDLFELAVWMSKYYHASLSQVFKIMLPASVRKHVKARPQPLAQADYFRTKSKKLNAGQADALEKIICSLTNFKFETHLLHGITGSGKTEIYLQALDKALELGKGAIVLVPEISLTAQTIERFRSRFEEKIAVLHHRLSQGERSEEWKAIRDGTAKIVIGARSAIFSPVKNLGLIIVDEEHEHSYKQSEAAPCYHARDVAVMRGSMTRAAVILGSATPSLESYHNARQGKYLLSSLNSRAESSKIPHVTIVDMNREFERAKGFTNFSELLLDGIKKRHEKGEQTILFLNRRGYHTAFFCSQCKQALKCLNCDKALAYHHKEEALSCHLCGYALSPPPRECPTCQNPDLMKYRGVGTELLESSLHAVFPEVRTLRIDADTTKHKDSHQKLLREFGTGKADVLIGTQMIAKGLHFPEVTLVGIINCDSALNIPDFKSSETVFQLITQVAGRAGRGDLPGEVILQTCMPENRTIGLAARQDYIGFFEEEIAGRKEFLYPPFINMVKIAFSGDEEKAVCQAADSFRQTISTMTKSEILHPVVSSGHAKVKNKYRFHFLIRGPTIYGINKVIDKAKKEHPIPRTIKMLIDVNPISTYF